MILHSQGEAMGVTQKQTGALVTTLWLLFLFGVCQAQEKKKISYGVLIDNTGSMRSQFDSVLEIGRGVVHQVASHGPVSLFDFHSEGTGPGRKAIPTLRLAAAQDEKLLDRTIDSLYVEGGLTTLFDAIEFIGEHLNDKSDQGDKVIVLITDGEDRSSKVKQKQLIQYLKVRNIRVYAVGLVRELDSTAGFLSPAARSKATNLLKLIATETGGRAVFPKSNRVDLQGLLAELAIPIS